MTGGTSKSYPYTNTSYKIFNSASVSNQFEILEEIDNLSAYTEEDEDLTPTDTEEDEDLILLENGTEMFKYNNKITEFNLILSNLVNGTEMFYNCTNLQVISSQMPKLQIANKMFTNCFNLSAFEVEELPNFILGEEMFAGC